MLFNPYMDYLTTAQVAKRLGVTRRRVQALIKRGQLEADRYGKAYLISEEQLQAFLERRRTEPGRPKGT